MPLSCAVVSLIEDIPPANLLLRSNCQQICFVCAVVSLFRGRTAYKPDQVCGLAICQVCCLDLCRFHRFSFIIRRLLSGSQETQVHTHKKSATDEPAVPRRPHLPSASEVKRAKSRLARSSSYRSLRRPALRTSSSPGRSAACSQKTQGQAHPAAAVRRLAYPSSGRPVPGWGGRSPLGLARTHLEGKESWVLARRTAV